MSTVRRSAALLWDVGDILAETEAGGDGHRIAFDLAFEAMGLPWRWSEAHCGRLLRDMQQRTDAPERPA